MNALILAWAYLRFYWGRSVVLMLVAALILSVPFATQVLLASSQQQLTARAVATPLLLGQRGSGLDLTMNALYFADHQPSPLTMAAVEGLWDSGLGTPIPLHTAYRTAGFPIVGTTLDYFEFRRLSFAAGRALALLGEAVIGATVAERLDKGVGDTLISTPENLFDLDGIYPLEMPIVGVLERRNSADDEAVFVDIKTAWIIAGIGHGHEDVVSEEQVMAGEVIADASVVEYQRITPENIDGFHFHGAGDDYPVTAVIVDPFDRRSATILKGRYLDPEAPLQLIEPIHVVRGIVHRLFRVKTLLDAVTVIIGGAALAAVGLALYLSLRLRAGEMATAVKLGAQRGTIVQLVAAEMAILLSLAITLAALVALAIDRYGEDWVHWLLVLG
ncbi:MAG: ABC transporter permease [Candidatus Competibacterales bacterium]